MSISQVQIVLSASCMHKLRWLSTACLLLLDLLHDSAELCLERYGGGDDGVGLDVFRYRADVLGTNCNVAGTEIPVGWGMLDLALHRLSLSPPPHLHPSATPHPDWFCIEMGSGVSHLNLSSLSVGANLRASAHKPQFWKCMESGRIEPRSVYIYIYIYIYI